MDDHFKELVKPRGMLVDAAVAGVWFLFFATILTRFAPDQGPALAWSIPTAACMTGVFWIALNMFRLVRVDEARRKGGRG